MLTNVSAKAKLSAQPKLAAAKYPPQQRSSSQFLLQKPTNAVTSHQLSSVTSLVIHESSTVVSSIHPGYLGRQSACTDTRPLSLTLVRSSYLTCILLQSKLTVYNGIDSHLHPQWGTEIIDGLTDQQRQAVPPPKLSTLNPQKIHIRLCRSLAYTNT